MKIIFGTAIVAIGIVGAFATHATSHKTALKDDTTYYWYDTQDGTGTQHAGTIDERKTATGCGDNGTFCEDGYAASQFVGNNPANPLKSGEVENPSQELFMP